ncbi:riboflavin biosynthesis protein RibF [Paenisporosarcina sp. TG20]|uniref:riboflavin biosynthesis protein RibF n=1 Tax=Paenisporosarcina sp. TG20 TaxID=1211706 RepID=UPI0002F7ACA3|nr:riboflavin biosynthesis protein RibF [Paenisporosarcina sp. TG20]
MNIVQLSYPHHVNDPLISGPFSLAIGFFDGVHLGHREVIEHAKKIALEQGLKLAVMTFDPHPSIVLGKRNEKVFYITPLDQKLKLLESMGIDTTFVVRFTSDFAQLTPEMFVETFIVQLNVTHVTAGFDFTFGTFGTGNMNVMKQLAKDDFYVSVIKKKSIGTEKISSTRIRQALTTGDMEQACELLGRPFQIPGVVVHGDKRGRQIGFPTANIQAREGSYIPATGVYSVRMLVQDEWIDGVCNVGYKPTFKDPNDKKLTIEVHLFNFDKNIYGEEVYVDWYHHIRNEHKFDGIDSLKNQIEKDKHTAMSYLRNLEF